MMSAESDEEVDIECDFEVERDQFTAENVVKSELQADDWRLQVKLAEDVDADSKEAIMKLLQADESLGPVYTAPSSSQLGAVYTPPSSSKHSLATNKSNQTMKQTSRRQVWSDEDKSLFITGVEIYGRSWKDIQELLPHKTLTQVRSYGQYYFKNNSTATHQNLIKPDTKKRKKNNTAASVTHAAGIAAGMTVPESLLLPGGPTDLHEVHLISKQDDTDEDVDILNDSDSAISDSSTDRIIHHSSQPESDDDNDNRLTIDIERRQVDPSLDQTAHISMSQRSQRSAAVRDLPLTEQSFHNQESADNLTIHTDKSPIKLEKLVGEGGAISEEEGVVPSQAVADLITINEDSFRALLSDDVTLELQEQLTQTNDTQLITSDAGTMCAHDTVNYTEGGVLLPYNDAPDNQQVETTKSSKTELNSLSAEIGRDSLTIPQRTACEPRLLTATHDTEAARRAHTEQYLHDLKQVTELEIESAHNSAAQTFSSQNCSSILTDSGEITTNRETTTNEEITTSDIVSPVLSVTTLKPEYGVLNSNGEIIAMSAPTSDTKLNRDTVTDLERQVHFEFFENRSNKTPQRYLRIRNYLLDQWALIQPKYLTKTSVRQGLKNCGDVNCIGRIHGYLEQLGAINFGCAAGDMQTQADIELSSRSECSDTHVHSLDDTHVVRRHSASMAESGQDMDESTANVKRHGWRRKRKPTVKALENEGTTQQHASDEDVALPPQKSYKAAPNKHSLDSFTLISCVDFSNSVTGCPYQVVLESTAAVIMDIHSHLCKTEVIGLLGGKYDRDTGSLLVHRAEPCSSKSSSMHCDMDPVSQTEAGLLIQEAGLQVVGWYHSHPTFVPDPSQQDIESQGVFQKWFSQGGDHFLGVIISPYNITNNSPNSEIRCFTTGTSLNSGNSKRRDTPFRFDYKVQTSASNDEMGSLVQKVSRLLDMYANYAHTVDLLDSYRSTSELTSLDKMLLSIDGYLSTADKSQVDVKLLIEDLRYVITSHCEKSG